MTASDLLERLSPTISPIKLAYLVTVGAIAQPVRIVTSETEVDVLFDDGHLIELRGVLANPNREPKELRAEKEGRFVPIEQVGSGYTDAARESLRPREPDLERALDRKVGPVSVEDIHGPRASLPRRIWRYLTRFRLYNVRLTGSEQARLAALQSTVAVLAPVWVVAFVGPRVRRFGRFVADRCLLEYVIGFERIGWGRFENELQVASSLAGIDPDLLSVPISEGLARIARVESEYDRLSREVFDYLRAVDSEGLILKRVVRGRLLERVTEILGNADQRGRQVLDDMLPAKSKLQEILQKGIEQLGKAAV